MSGNSAHPFSRNSWTSIDRERNFLTFFRGVFGAFVLFSYFPSVRTTFSHTPRERTEDHGAEAAAAQGAEPVVPTEAPQQGPGRTQPYKGRNRWFQQRPRNKDQGAAGRCENLTKASGTDEIAKKSPPLPPSTVRARTSSGVGGFGSGHEVQIFGGPRSEFEVSKIDLRF